MFHRFLVPLDGSSRAEKALPVAAALARATGGTIILAHVVVPPISDEYGTNTLANEMQLIQAQEQTEVRTYLDDVRERYDHILTGLHLILDAVPDDGTIPSTLLSLVDQEHGDLIVMCSRADSAFKRWVLGSVAQSTLRKSPVPVLVLNNHDTSFILDARTRPLRLLLPLDGSSFSESVFKPLGQLLELIPSREPHELHLLQVVTIPAAVGRFRSGANVTDLLQQDEKRKAEHYLKGIARQISDWLPTGVAVSVTTEAIVQTDVTRTILQHVQAGEQSSEKAYDMLALATHGRSGIRRALLGSVTEHLFGLTTLPLFVVPPAHPDKEHRTDGQHAVHSRPPQGPVGLL